MSREYTIEDFISIIKRLRGEGGCPWDREQTHESISFSLIEEAYEACDAIDKKDSDAMADELGDVLLQVIFHSQIGAEEGTFDFSDVLKKVCEKMIRRHPHVFGTVSADTSDEVLTNWEEIKKEEKGITNNSQALEDVVRCLPALVRAQKIQKKAIKAEKRIEKLINPKEFIKETLKELTDEEKRDIPIEEAIGELLFAVVDLARRADVNPELALSKTNDRFIQKFSKMEYEAKKQGKDMGNLTMNALENLWKLEKK